MTLEKKSFTLKYDHPSLILCTNVLVSEVNQGLGVGCGEFNAVWDTGATNTVITENIVGRLGLEPIGVVEMHTVNGTREGGVYLVDLCLPNQLWITGVPAIDSEINDADVLIGMDIISMGDFAITNKFDKTWFTFQTPPTHRIDFVEEWKREQGKPGFRKQPKN